MIAPKPPGRRTPTTFGFSLLELLLVLGIVAALVAALLPAVAYARQRAGEIRCMDNLRNIGVATTAYVTQSEGWIPRDAFSASNAFFAPWLWRPLALPAPDEHVMTVNGFTGPRVQVDVNYCVGWLDAVRVFRCPAVDAADPHVLQYVINSMDFNWYLQNGIYRGTPWQRMDSVPSAGSTAYLFEANIDYLPPASLGKYKVAKPGDLPYLFPPNANAGHPNARQPAIDTLDRRHGGRSCILFFDGHVESHDLRSYQDWPVTLLNPYAH